MKKKILDKEIYFSFWIHSQEITKLKEDTFSTQKFIFFFFNFIFRASNKEDISINKLQKWKEYLTKQANKTR